MAPCSAGKEVLKAALAPLAQLRTAANEFASVCAEVEERQKQSLAAKKKLSDDTKSFKRLGDSEKLIGLQELLRSYQGEVDALTKRAKFAEAAFVQLHQAFEWVPDPAVVRGKLEPLINSDELQAIEAKLAEKDALIVKWREAAQSLEEELQTCTNQDTAVRRLERQARELEATADDKVADARRLKDEEWAHRLEVLRQELGVEKAHHAETRVQLAQLREVHADEIERLCQQHAEEQRMAEESINARSAEVETMSSDFERLQAEYESVKAELERDRLQHEGSQRSTQGSVAMLQSLLDGVQQRAAASEKEAEDLHAKVSRLEAQEQLHDKRTSDLAARLASLDAEASSLREQLATRPSQETVDDLRRQLQNVETVEQGSIEGASTDLELRLLQKQRSLLYELNEGRARTQELQAETVRLEAALREARSEAEELRGKPSARMASEAPHAAYGDADLKGIGSVGNAAVIAAMLPSIVDRGDSLALGGVGGSFGAGTGHFGQDGTAAMPSMLEIVSGQRDGLRARVGDLEHERDFWKGEAERERKRADVLKQDNVKLLERARYLQSLQPKGSGRTRGPARADVEDKYAAAYEEGLGPISPFEAFREDERRKRLASLSAGERVLVTTGALLLASKEARVCTIVYVGTLHMAIFIVLWWEHTHQHC